MTDLGQIQEIKELDDISEVNSLLKENWILLSIRELEDKNIYILGLSKWSRFGQYIKKED
ncbi:hypothetical protein [Acinetobacter pullicarnis]|uniref:hypothetical protein n=1 Tax=Acinetobacter pullicarnis TaxID=2576829 RepID=UPI0011236145|nr:hypothetical protein [Acinetobacter pullicarnis]